MRKLRNLIGMPVVVNGRRLGRLVHAQLTDDLRRLSGVWVDSGLLGTRHIPAENLEMIGCMAVMADDRGKRMRCRVGFGLHRAVATDGRRLGAITGAEIDELSFLVQALELSGGLWDDLYSGRRRILRYTVSPENGEVVVQDSAEQSDKEEEQ